MDFGTLIGILVGFGLVIGSIAMGPEPMGITFLIPLSIGMRVPSHH